MRGLRARAILTASASAAFGAGPALDTQPCLKTAILVQQGPGGAIIAAAHA